MPTAPAARAPSGSPLPTAWPTRAVVAMPRASGIMKVMEAVWIATWCPASEAGPKRPISSADTAKRPVSKATVSAIGQPRRNTSPAVGPSQRQGATNTARARSLRAT